MAVYAGLGRGQLDVQVDPTFYFVITTVGFETPKIVLRARLLLSENGEHHFNVMSGKSKNRPPQP